MPLTITPGDLDGHPMLAVAGDLDMATAPSLTSAAMNLIAAGARDVIIDVHELAFCDSSGLAAFVQISSRVGPEGGRLAIAGPQSIVRRILEISGLDEAFLVVASVRDAIAELSAA
jgi:anti-sigma B factor antagonist